MLIPFHVFYDNLHKIIEIDPEITQKIGDFQLCILRKLGMRPHEIVCLVHDRGILGKDVSFNELTDKLVYFPKVFIIVDYFPQDGLSGMGTQSIFLDWMETKLESPVTNKKKRKKPKKHKKNSVEQPVTSEHPVTSERPAERTAERPAERTAERPAERPTTAAMANEFNDLVRSLGLGNMTNEFNDLFQSLGLGNIGPTNQSVYTSTTQRGGDNWQSVVTTFEVPVSSSSSSSNSAPNIFSLMLDLMNTQLGPPGSTQPFYSYVEYINNLEDVPVTLDPESVNKLPVFIYNELKHQLSKLSDDSPDNCSVCLEKYDDSEEVKVLLCKHYFHKVCIDTWLTNNSTYCPLCRKDTRDSNSNSS